MGDHGRVPVLLGISGFVEGERIVLARGADVTIGRSRTCTVSLRRAAKYLEAPAATRDEDHDFNTVSRVHIVLRIDGDAGTITDSSTNGTWCNGEPVKGSRSLGLGEGGCVIRLGTRESFDLQLLSADDERIRGLPVTGG
jgi:pSer/pThr/pTyr-binding forkhead associated (FHA) protein